MSPSVVLSYISVLPDVIPLTVFQTGSQRICSKQCAVLALQLIDEYAQQPKLAKKSTDDLGCSSISFWHWLLKIGLTLAKLQEGKCRTNTFTSAGPLNGRFQFFDDFFLWSLELIGI